jgi:hypothetical protein
MRTTTPIRRRGVRLIPLRRLGDSVRRQAIRRSTIAMIAESNTALRSSGYFAADTLDNKANHRVAIVYTHFDVQGVRF